MPIVHNIEAAVSSSIKFPLPKNARRAPEDGAIESEEQKSHTLTHTRTQEAQLTRQTPRYTAAMSALSVNPRSLLRHAAQRLRTHGAKKSTHRLRRRQDEKSIGRDEEEVKEAVRRTTIATLTLRKVVVDL